MAIFEFREMKQEQGETLNAFYRQLKEQAPRYEFHDEDREIKRRKACVEKLYKKT